MQSNCIFQSKGKKKLWKYLKKFNLVFWEGPHECSVSFAKEDQRAYYNVENQYWMSPWMSKEGLRYYSLNIVRQNFWDWRRH
eukprot:UN27215